MTAGSRPVPFLQRAATYRVTYISSNTHVFINQYTLRMTRLRGTNMPGKRDLVGIPIVSLCLYDFFDRGIASERWTFFVSACVECMSRLLHMLYLTTYSVQYSSRLLNILTWQFTETYYWDTHARWQVETIRRKYFQEKLI